MQAISGGLEQQRRAIGFSFTQHRPDHASHLVGHRHRRYLFAFACSEITANHVLRPVDCLFFCNKIVCVVPAEFTAYQVENSMVSRALFQYGVVLPNGEMQAQLNAGAQSFTVPFWSDTPDVEADITNDVLATISAHPRG